MHTVQDRVVVDPPAAVIAERQRLGLDQRDEVWDGEYHMVPPANNEHARIGGRLFAALLPVTDRAALEIRMELGLFPPAGADHDGYWVPDLIVYRPELGTERGADGPASLVVEVRSPGDDSLRKLPHYERLGVGEVLIIDRDTKVVRRWSLVDRRLVESPGDPAGHHRLACIPVTLHTDRAEGGVLVVTTPDGGARI